MTKIFVYVDESGTLPDPHDRFVVLAAVASQRPVTFKKKNIQSSSELKFYTSGKRGRIIYLESLAKEPVVLFTLAINKGSQKISDSSENYAVLSWLLLIDCVAYFENDKLEVIFDRHFSRESDEKKLFLTLNNLLKFPIFAKSADSQTEPGIRAADMVAGAFLYSKVGKTSEYYDLIKSKVIIEKEINWKEAKKNFIDAIKNSPEPV